MKKIAYIVGMFSIIFFGFSCTKNVVEFDTSDVSHKAEVRMIYALPVTGADYNITKLTYNDQLYSLVSTVPGSGWPGEAKWHVMDPGSANVKMYRTVSGASTLFYENTFTAAVGKQTAFLYNLNEPPLVLDEGFPFPKLDPWKDTVSFVNFVNLYFQSDGVTPLGKVQLKTRRGANTAESPYVYTNVGSPVNFKENTGWTPVPLLQASAGGGLAASGSGAETVTFLMYLVDANGVESPFPYFSTGSTVGTYTAAIALTKGRYFWLTIRGKQGATSTTGQIIALNSRAAVGV